MDPQHPEDDDEAARDEESAQLQCDVIDSARALMQEHGYTFDDILAMLRATVAA